MTFAGAFNRLMGAGLGPEADAKYKQGISPAISIDGQVANTVRGIVRQVKRDFGRRFCLGDS
jgi:hypothetical protein